MLSLYLSILFIFLHANGNEMVIDFLDSTQLNQMSVSQNALSTAAATGEEKNVLKAKAKKNPFEKTHRDKQIYKYI